MGNFYNHRPVSSDQHQRDIKELMMPGNYSPRRHRDRAMPPRPPRLTATEQKRK